MNNLERANKILQDARCISDEYKEINAELTKLRERMIEANRFSAKLMSRNIYEESLIEAIKDCNWHEKSLQQSSGTQNDGILGDSDNTSILE